MISVKNNWKNDEHSQMHESHIVELWFKLSNNKNQTSPAKKLANAMFIKNESVVLNALLTKSYFM